MKTTVYSLSPYEKPFLEKQNKNGIELNYRKEKLSKETVSLAEGSEAVSIFTNDDASAEVLEELKKTGIKYITTRSMGVDHIDLEKTKDLGIKVANVPHYSPHSVAEHSLSLMLALNRKLIPASRKIQDYNFRLNGLVGFDMHNKTVGMLGAGEIGAVSAKILHGFGCKLMIYDVKKDQDLIEKYDAKYVELEELCKNSDIITIHAPLTKDTKHLINKENISLMKEGVMIINTARGAICKTEDLIEGLKNGKIGSLGLDVYEYEKDLFFEDHSTDLIQDDLFVRLIGFKNVLITAHQAFLTNEALKENIEATLKNLESWSNAKEAKNEVE
ncbi:2-hydroxyacid dehydrogenase [Salegentibacter salarius]|uniref:Hydroxyacid dehydrogenase n=1 Tax=Salegentibacter salarius TaxID=435906 RepID=A0A2N0U0J3_9FLAO|nr:2-hydroxyacid dehydrogenase [Salegentibacter salarius]OEY73497.1 hydroxyacid dehydrogenase [Salegentibacter salarius]PKD20533.1 hydroxyacid dehydrogenase [Salegentibacter salarius]SLJ96378.1 D-lactate dehydrogenase [Salegentibacter salarius]